HPGLSSRAKAAARGKGRSTKTPAQRRTHKPIATRWFSQSQSAHQFPPAVERSSARKTEPNSGPDNSTRIAGGKRPQPPTRITAPASRNATKREPGRTTQSHERCAPGKRRSVAAECSNQNLARRFPPSAFRRATFERQRVQSAGLAV